MKTKGRRVSSNISVVDPKTNARDNADYKREQDNKKTITKMVMEDRAMMSPYLTEPKKMKDQTPITFDNVVSAQKNNYPHEKAMKLKHLRDESYPAQKFTKPKGKGDRLQRIQVTPGKWVTK